MSALFTELRAAGLKPDPTYASFFRHREVGGKVLVTGWDGSWLLLDHEAFRALVTGTVSPGSELETRLAQAGFVRAKLDVAVATERLRARRDFLHYGPNLHMLVVTLRCNETCVYCHASRADMDAVHTDMTKETAEQCVDFALQSTSPAITLEFQGGEPLVNYPVVQHVIAYGKRRAKEVGKTVEFTMVTNLSLMDEEKLAYLMSERVQLCTSIDGPEHLHDKQRKLPGFSSHKAAVGWIKRINEAYEQAGLDPTLYRVEALLTTTRETLPRWKEVVDTYVELGCRALFLRPIDPFGFMDKTGPRVEYPRADYLEFYRKSVDYMLALNAGGTQILERYAAIFLTKILSGVDPNFLDIRSPGGAAIGGLAYDYDGSIYTSDEGRMLAAKGDHAFRVGHVRDAKYREVMGHDTVRAEVLASLREQQPDCVSCTYSPYCGVPPVHSHKTQGSIFGRMRESTVCAVHKGIQDYLFEKIAEGDPKVRDTFEKWTTVRAREHFLVKPA